MNNTVKSIALLIGGAGLGAGGMFIFMKKAFVSRQEHECEIESMKRQFMDERVRSAKEKPSMEDLIKAVKDEPTDISAEQDEAIEAEFGPEELITNAKEIVKDYISYDKPQEVETHNKPEPKPKKKVKNYLIDSVEFSTLLNGYEKKTLMLYTDGTLADGQDDEMVSVDATIGYELYNRFLSNGEKTCYIRNESKATDYEVYRSEMTFMEQTGYDPKAYHDEEE